MTPFRSMISGTQFSMQNSRPLLLDGGMGTMLQARGLPAGVAPERFCLERPDVLRGIHADYLKAGADVIITCTFGGNRLKLPADVTGLGVNVHDFNYRMAQIAREAASAAGREAWVAGDIGPCGHFVQPLGDLPPDELYAVFREQARGLADGGVDVIIIETQFDLAEARLAVAAVRAECDLPVMVSMTFEKGVSLTGSTPEIFAATMRNMGVDAVGCNCGLGPEQMAEIVGRFLACAGLPVLAEPNAGLPELVNNETRFRLPPAPFAAQTAEFVRMGAKLVGGCCGTTPDHIAALRQAVDSLGEIGRAIQPSAPSGLALTSRASLVRLGAGQPLRIIGERINPTGKKVLTAELQAGAFSTALTFAAEQIALGSPVLDVNVGAPMVDEVVLLPQLVRELVQRYTEPLSLDSSNPKAIAAALPWHPGSALVNSINGDGLDENTGPMSILGPLCRQWGAPYILLPLRGKKLPVKASERIAIIEAMLLRAEELGLPRHLALVDVLALSVASKAEAAREGLETLRWCAANGLPTVMGLSNISFGLPARELVNATWLAMSMGAGLSSCIANPSSVRLDEARMAGDVLLGADPGAERFVNGFAQWTSGNAETSGSQRSESAAMSKPKTVHEAIVRGDSEAVIPLVDEQLALSIAPGVLVNTQMIPAIVEVGERYERREYFLPQLLRSAEAMQTAFAHVKPLLELAGGQENRPVVVVATVEGDIHDIGKNIVTLMLRNHGFTVVDLGKDIKAETIVAAAVEHKASVIGLSALMTTTMVRMEDTVKLVKEQNLPVRVMVGGAVVTPAFAERIGADGFSADAVGAVRLAQELIK